MDNQTIIKYLRENDISKIKFAFADIDGVLRGKIISSKKFIDGLESGYGFCDVVFGWDSADELYEKVSISGWQSGFPDQICHIDLQTFRLISWQDNIPFFLADFGKVGGNGLVTCPRSLLKRVIEECKTFGYHAEFSQEFEWFNFQESPDSLHEKQFMNLKPLTPNMFGYSMLRPSLQHNFANDIFNRLQEFGVELEALHTETGPGVYEAAIAHDQILKAADKAVLFKTAVKEIAYLHGFMASFMAKWNEKLPGCSGHIHQSLWNQAQTENLFYDKENPEKITDNLKHYLAGQLYCLPHILPMYAPTVNSYKRLTEETWAPTTASWGYDNRTVALRVINSSHKGTRLETRVPGADCNPYLAMAAALASGLYGIKHKLPLDSVCVMGNAYEDTSAKKLPANLHAASISMQQSGIAIELFGKEFVEHFTATRLWEWEKFSKQVTDWELKRYFEII